MLISAFNLLPLAPKARGGGRQKAVTSFLGKIHSGVTFVLGSTASHRCDVRGYYSDGQESPHREIV